MRLPFVDQRRTGEQEAPSAGLKEAKCNALILASVMSLTLIALYIADGRLPLIPILMLIVAFFAAAYPSALAVFHLSRAVKGRKGPGTTRS